jgi:hypothetical protein
VEGNPSNRTDPSGKCWNSGPFPIPDGFPGRCEDNPAYQYKYSRAFSQICNPYSANADWIETCRFNDATYGTNLTYVRRAEIEFVLGEDNLNDNDICPIAGPPSGADACLFAQQPSEIKTIVLHHTGGDIASFPNIRQDHLNRTKLDRIDFGFHFWIEKNGIVDEGRPMYIRGSHATGGNMGSIGIELEGNFDIDLPADIQIENTKILINAIKNQVSFQGGNILYLETHLDVEGTKCPGSRFTDGTYIGDIALETGLTIKKDNDWGVYRPWE